MTGRGRPKHQFQRILLMALCAEPLSWVLSAQTAGGGRQRFAFALAVAVDDERDETVSPLRYRGTGWGVAGGYGFETARWRTSVDLTFGAAGLHATRPSVLPTSSHQEWLSMQLASMRELATWRRDRMRVFGGVAVAGALAARDQRYTSAETRSYLSGLVAIGPAVQLELDRRPTSTLTYRVSTPLVAGVIQSYSDVHVLRDPQARRLEWTGPSTYRALEQLVSYTAAVGGHVGWRADARWDLFAYEREPRVRGQRTIISVGLMWWTRGKP